MIQLLGTTEEMSKVLIVRFTFQIPNFSAHSAHLYRYLVKISFVPYSKEFKIMKYFCLPLILRDSLGNNL